MEETGETGFAAACSRLSWSVRVRTLLMFTGETEYGLFIGAIILPNEGKSSTGEEVVLLSLYTEFSSG